MVYDGNRDFLVISSHLGVRWVDTKGDWTYDGRSVRCSEVRGLRGVDYVVRNGFTACRGRWWGPGIIGDTGSLFR